jgi:hypothetical protein
MSSDGSAPRSQVSNRKAMGFRRRDDLVASESRAQARTPAPQIERSTGTSDSASAVSLDVQATYELGHALAAQPLRLRTHPTR